MFDSDWLVARHLRSPAGQLRFLQCRSTRGIKTVQIPRCRHLLSAGATPPNVGLAEGSPTVIQTPGDREKDHSLPLATSSYLFKSQEGPEAALSQCPEP